MYLIIGGNSFLGSYIIKNILEKTEEKILATYRSGIPFSKDKRITWINLDVTNKENINNLRLTLSALDGKVKCIYLVGYIKPDDVEKNPKLAWNINIAGLTNFINDCQNYLSSLYFSSTNMAVGESINGYKFKETDMPQPVNRYGVQKRICEQIVTELGFNVFRCPLMFGKSLIPNRPHFIEHIEETIKNKEYFEILSDYKETSICYDSIASLLVELIEKYGAIKDKIIHICSDKPISKYEIALQYCKKNNLNVNYLKPLLLKDCDFFIAKRCNMLLDNTLIKQYLKINEIGIGI